MNRRRWILGGAGLAAAAAGGAWRLSSTPGGLAPDPAAEAFWQTQFSQPDGQPLQMAALRGAPLVLNFWATWCAPCVKEMPELDRFARQFAAGGGRVVGLAVDNPTAVRNFLKQFPVSYTIGLAGFDGSELSRQLGNTSGALPFTVLFNRKGAVARRRLGQTNQAELRGWSGEL